jgi:glycosyltransferase involved in cell wall biosynthesis
MQPSFLIMSLFYNGLHKAWLRLPRSARQAAFYRLTSLTAPRPDISAPGGWPVGVAGLLSTATGLGEGARLNLDALEAMGADPAAFDVSPAFDQCDLPGAPPVRRQLQPGTGGTLLVHVNAPYLPFALRALGGDLLRGRRIVGYWAWELQRLPANWRFGFPFVHEVWVPSRFTRDAVASATGLPVHVVPHPLPLVTSAGLPSRHDFGLPTDALIVLGILHLGSSFARKNPLATVAAFRRAFGDDPSRILVLKLVDPGTAPWTRDRLRDAIGDAGNIRVIDRRMSRAELNGLIRATDIVVSLHRSEGFGLVPAEAMQLGKPVIATGWSGNLDFMNERNSALVSYRLVPAVDSQGTYDHGDQNWADADIDHAAAWLRRLAEMPDQRAAMGAAAAADIRRLFGLETFSRSVSSLIGGGLRG